MRATSGTPFATPSTGSCLGSNVPKLRPTLVCNLFQTSHAVAQPGRGEARP